MKTNVDCPEPASRYSRRTFIKAASAGSLVLMGRMARGQEAGLTNAAETDVDSFAPDYFVAIAPDGTVTCLAHRSEMGTGIRTGLPRVIADELGADWQRVEIQQAIGDKRLGDQNTDGSNSIRFFFDRMRIAGATARTMLEQAAAKKWGVPAKDCYAEMHQVKHRNSNRMLGFGDLVATAKTLAVPPQSELQFKPRSQWKYIGKDAPIVDLDDIVTGKAVFGIDARMDNQLFAVIARPPVVGGKVEKVNSAAAKKIPGVVEVVQIPGFEGAPLFQALGGVAVCATSTWAAWQGRDALEIQWDDGPNADYNTAEFAKLLTQSARKPGQVLRAVGNTKRELAQSENRFSADYSVPHLSHAPMEPTCAVADVQVDATNGKITRCHILAATQNPQAVQEAVGAALGIEQGEVLVNVTLLGSGFGRKSKPDYCVEAALLSRQLARPVHVTWTREDDLQHDYYHAISAMHLEAAIDSQGMPKAWLQRAAYPTIDSTFNAASDVPAAWEAEMGHTDLPFDIPNMSLEVGSAKSHVRIGWLRSVCHIQQNFAVSSFADELAHLADEDPFQYLLKLLGPDRHMDLKAANLANRGASEEDYPCDIGRLKNVLRRVAKDSNWNGRSELPKGRGMGIACARSFLGYTGHVVEVSVDRDGTLHIPNVWVSLDAGTIVCPDRVRAQVEGAAIMATTQARYGKITFTNGRADQTNYDSYQMVKMADTPKNIHIDVVDSEAAPAGVGETGIASYAPALCNAIFAATGKRIRDLPIADHDLSWA
ncbi:MAG: xanthine dehydrogenase family protein molybdopterin-binding subunit [Planctomycetales bacterium]|nr:xanthine dehydrogenase family protein molybdopterin-binding subunit [Planctomycetales bacterium]